MLNRDSCGLQPICRCQITCRLMLHIFKAMKMVREASYSIISAIAVSSTASIAQRIRIKTPGSLSILSSTLYLNL